MPRKQAAWRLIQLLLIPLLIFGPLAGWPSQQPVQAQGETPEPPAGELPVKVYLPLNVYTPAQPAPNPYTVEGQVLDLNGQPVPNVTITDQTGRKTTSGLDGRYVLDVPASGSYALAPSHESLMFEPAFATANVPAASDGLNFTALTSCTDVVTNGGFESTTAWEIVDSAWKAGYTYAAAHSGVRSMLAGILNPADNRYSYSAARQTLNIPATAQTVTLRMWIYPLTGETEAASQELPRPSTGETLEALSAASGDTQYVVVVDEFNNIIETLLWERSNARQWRLHEFSLVGYAGKTVKLQFGVFNDGADGVTSMYVDDISIQVCTTSTQPEPAPIGCQNLLQNSGFEARTSWSTPTTNYSAGYSVYRAHSGASSMRTGIVYESHNTYSYSDAWQSVYVPWNATSAKLSMWVYQSSTEVAAQAELTPPDPSQFGIESEAASAAAAEALASDAQYVLLIDIYGNVDYLYWTRRNTQSWNYIEFDLKKYAGQTVRIQFGTYNDGWGGVTSMYVDDIFLDACTTTPVTPTPPPDNQCTERVDNGGFEWISDWSIPWTNFTAGYSNFRYHSGARSMRTGIVYAAHNRYSYSDAYQTVYIPSNSRSAWLTLWAYPTSNEPTSLALADQPTAALVQTEALGSDVQYVLLLDSYGNWIDTLVWQRSNAQSWVKYSFDLSRYAGRTLRVQFGTYNDGWSGVTSMYVDDVSLVACP